MHGTYLVISIVLFIVLGIVVGVIVQHEYSDDKESMLGAGACLTTAAAAISVFWIFVVGILLLAAVMSIPFFVGKYSFKWMNAFSTKRHEKKYSGVNKIMDKS